MRFHEPPHAEQQYLYVRVLVAEPNAVVPNLFGVVVVYASVTVPNIVLTESVLSFLGLGVQEPMTSWGVLIQDGAQKLESMPWLLLCPAVMLCVTLYCVNFVGDGLRDAFDPKDR